MKDCPPRLALDVTVLVYNEKAALERSGLRIHEVPVDWADLFGQVARFGVVGLVSTTANFAALFITVITNIWANRRFAWALRLWMFRRQRQSASVYPAHRTVSFVQKALSS